MKKKSNVETKDESKKANKSKNDIKNKSESCKYKNYKSK